MKRKILVAVSLILVLSFLMMACGNQQKDDAAVAEDPVQVVAVGPVTGGVAWGNCEVGLKIACEELGWEGQFLAPTQANDMTQMVTMLETALTNGADVIMICASDKEMYSDVLGRARDAGVVVITMNTIVGEELSNAWIGTNPQNMGKNQAKAVLAEAEKDGLENLTVAYIQTRLASTTQNAQFDSMCEEILKVYPNAEFIHDECQSNAQTMADKVAAYRASYPELNVVVSQDGYGTPGLANYIEGEGIQDSFIGIGVDDSPEILDFVKNGVLRCTVAQDFYTIGYGGCMLAKTVLEGGKIEYSNDSGSQIIYAAECDEHLKLLQDRGIV